MKDTLGIVLMILSPFIVGALILLGIKFQEMYQQWKYENSVAERNAKLESYGLKPFRGTKLRIHNSELDSAHRTNMFSAPHGRRDPKGIYK